MSSRPSVGLHAAGYPRFAAAHSVGRHHSEPSPNPIQWLAPGSCGWIIGHFLDAASDGVRASERSSSSWSPASSALSCPPEPFVLKDQGDDAMWGPGIDHSWHAEEDSVIITVR